MAWGEDTLTFGVGDLAGARSETWFVRIGGREIFVGQRRRPSLIHFSAHESGTWHISLTRPDEPSVYPHRFAQPTEVLPGVELVFTLLIPDDAVVSGSPPVTVPAVWLPVPGEGFVHEVVVVRISFDHPGQVRHAPARWASARHVGTIEGDGCVAVVLATRRQMSPAEHDVLEGLMGSLADRRRERSDGPQRSIVWGSNDGVSWYFAEAAVP